MKICYDGKDTEELLLIKTETCRDISQNHGIVQTVCYNGNGITNQQCVEHTIKKMNTAVGSFVPKGKHYSTKHLLLTRLGLAIGCQLLGHAKL